MGTGSKKWENPETKTAGDVTEERREGEGRRIKTVIKKDALCSRGGDIIQKD